MAWKKICPACKHQNPPMSGFCDKCDYDLSGEVPQNVSNAPMKPLTLVTAEQAPQVLVEPSSAGNMRPIRRCPSCGRSNMLTTTRCVQCGADISMSVPMMEADAMWTVKTRDGIAKLTVSDGQHYIIGVRNYLSYGLPVGGYVSGAHIEVSCEGGKLFISHLSRSNPTLVNGRMIPRDAESRTELKAGDIICMGNYPGQADDPRAGYLVISKE